MRPTTSIFNPSIELFLSRKSLVFINRFLIPVYSHFRTEDEGEIFVEEVADCGNKTKGNVDIEAEKHIEAAFEVESFSSFTVTWLVGGTEDIDGGEVAAEFTLNFYSVDQNGNKTTQSIPGNLLNIGDELKISHDWDIMLAEYFKDAVQGYEFVSADYSTMYYKYQEPEGFGFIPIMEYKPNGTSYYEKSEGRGDNITELEIRRLSNTGFPYLIKIYNNEGIEVMYPGGVGTQKEDGRGNEYLKALEVTLNLYYTRGQLGIINTIGTNGMLTADTELKDLQSDAYYQWYKWARGDADGENNAEPIEEQIITGDKWNITNEGQSINVALDKGSNHYYQVRIMYKDDNGEEHELMRSRPLLVDYYDSLQNGGFENVKLNGSNWHQYPNGYKDLVWKSTTGKTEIVRHGSTEHNLHSGSPWREGEQCGELNPQASGALYQDVLTIPGTTLHWELMHRARGSQPPGGIGATPVLAEDTMHVLIMPTEVAERVIQEKLDEIMQQEGFDRWDTAYREECINNALNDMINEILENIGLYPGTMIKDLRSNNNSWTRYGGEYVVGKEQYLTRFFFIAGETGSNDPTRGNLIDNVWFNYGLPPVSDNYGSLLITKTIDGLSAEEVRNYTLGLEVTTNCNLSDDSRFEYDSANQCYKAQVVLKNFTEVENGAYSKAVSFRQLPLGDYTIKEILPNAYSQPTNISMENIIRDENGIETSTPISKNENLSATVSLAKIVTTSVRITNSYARTGNFVVRKIFEKGIGNIFKPGDKEFSDVQFGLYATDEHWTLDSFKQYDFIGEIKLEEDESGSQDKVGIINFKSIPEGNYFLHEQEPPTGYKQSSDRRIVVGSPKEDMEFGVYLYNEKDDSYTCVSNANSYVDVVNEKEEENVPGAILPDTGGPGLAMFERYGWFLLMLALLMAGVEVRCYGERKYRRVSAGQHEEFEDPL